MTMKSHFLDFTVNDVDDYVTLRRRFDRTLQCRASVNERDLQIHEDKYRMLIVEQEILEKEIEELPCIQSFDQQEKDFDFPYQSFLNLRHWRKAPKTLKGFFQALACLCSIPTRDFLTTLKANHQFIDHLKSYRPSSMVMDEFRLKYTNSNEISPEYIRTKSIDAYLIVLWMHEIDENEQFNRMKSAHLNEQNRVEMKLNELQRQSANKSKEIQLINETIRNLKKNLDQTEKHRHILLQSN